MSGVLVTAVCYSTSTVGAQQPAERSVNDGVYAADQSKRGEMVYAETCAACHDPALTGGVGPALAGTEFITAWKEMTVGDLFDRVKTTMPLSAPGTLTNEQTADVVAFVLSTNKFPAGAAPLATDLEALKDVKMAEPGAAAGAAAAPATAAAPGAAPAPGAAAAPAAPGPGRAPPAPPRGAR